MVADAYNSPPLQLAAGTLGDQLRNTEGTTGRLERQSKRVEVSCSDDTLTLSVIKEDARNLEGQPMAQCPQLDL